MLLDISIIPQTSEELFYFVTKRIPYLWGVLAFRKRLFGNGKRKERRAAAEDIAVRTDG